MPTLHCSCCYYHHNYHYDLKIELLNFFLFSARFFTIRDDQPMVLSFVDYRRFGRWEVGADWSRDRGPDLMWEYEKFRENVLTNLKNAAFNRPICEVLLNQKFFNGIGNYLRAEILYR